MRCPTCGKIGHRRRGVHFDHELICPSFHTWNPDDYVRCPAGCLLPSPSTDGVYKIYDAAGPDGRWEKCNRCNGLGAILAPYTDTFVARTGDWMETYTGKRFYTCDPLTEEVCIEDIAHHLSLICRFGGACRTHYSVAQHSCHCATLVSKRFALQALLHDAHEAYLGDTIQPIKRSLPPAMAGWLKATADALDIAIFRKFGVRRSAESDATVKTADLRLLMAEARDLMQSNGAGYKHDCKPWPMRIEPWTFAQAKERFLTMHKELLA